MAATVMTAELALSSIIIVRGIFWSLLVQFFGQTLKLIGNYVNCDILIEYKLASSPCLTKIGFFIFSRIFDFFFLCS